MFSRIVKQSARQLQYRVNAVPKAPAARSFHASFAASRIVTSFDLPDPAAQPTNGDKGLQLTKIVATIGPTSEQLEPMQNVVKAGMKIMRLNFSHATVEEVELRTKNLALSQVS
jgi:hypothetical protein